MAIANTKQKNANAPKEYTFIWVGKDKKGKEVRGEMRATSDSLVKVALRSKGIQITKIKKQKFKNAKKIKQQDVAIFTRQLATMMKAGVPLLQSFEIVANGHANPSVAKLLFEIKNSIETGSSLADAFAQHPQYFDKLYCNLVDAGEKAGILEGILDRLAFYQEKIYEIKGKIKKAMFYPIAVLSVAFIVTAIIMIFVVPSFKEVFSSFGAQLPGPTLVVMAISDFFVSYWYLIFGAIGGSIWFLRRLIKTNEKVKNGFDRLLLKLPIFGEIFNKSAISRWARTLSTMYAAGVSLPEALESVAGAAGNIVYYIATKNVQKEVSTGQSLTTSMQQQNVFPNMVIQMTQIGEESGSLDTMLNKVAEFYENEVNDSVNALSSLIEPLIIAILGVVIGGLVVAMYLPIFKMAGAV
jgi:type IV pilus assembly protein PilC